MICSQNVYSGDLWKGRASKGCFSCLSWHLIPLIILSIVLKKYLLSGWEWNFSESRYLQVHYTFPLCCCNVLIMH